MIIFIEEYITVNIKKDNEAKFQLYKSSFNFIIFLLIFLN